MLFVCVCLIVHSLFFFFFKQKTAYEMRISDWSSDVCSSDLHAYVFRRRRIDRWRSADELIRDSPCRDERAPPNEENLLYSVHTVPFREIGRASCRERVCQYV